MKYLIYIFIFAILLAGCSNQRTQGGSSGVVKMYTSSHNLIFTSSRIHQVVINRDSLNVQIILPNRDSAGIYEATFNHLNQAMSIYIDTFFIADVTITYPLNTNILNFRVKATNDLVRTLNIIGLDYVLE